jgi:hypothetical protein
MATIATLVANRELIEIDGGLAPHQQPERLVYALPHVVQWLDQTLSTLRPFALDTMMTPIEQVYALFYDFISGDDFAYYERCHAMRPAPQGVWELKTTDVRLFGWFYRRGVFICANIDEMNRVKSLGLYAGYRNDIVYRRGLLRLDGQQFVVGGYRDVL